MSTYNLATLIVSILAVLSNVFVGCIALYLASEWRQSLKIRSRTNKMLHGFLRDHQIQNTMAVEMKIDPLDKDTAVGAIHLLKLFGWIESTIIQTRIDNSVSEQIVTIRFSSKFKEKYDEIFFKCADRRGKCDKSTNENVSKLQNKLLGGINYRR